jgi:hypothetical protein
LRGDFPGTTEIASENCDKCGSIWRRESISPGLQCYCLACLTCGRRIYSKVEIEKATVEVRAYESIDYMSDTYNLLYPGGNR